MRVRKVKHIFQAVIIILLVFLVQCHYREEEPPSFIIIQLDDLGWDDLSVHGNQLIETPNIDRLALQSLKFDNFYVNPVCAPTRASLLTGRHFLRTGVSHVHGGKDFINLNEQTMGDILKKNGYATGIWGKWHSGHTEGYFPWQRGFDEAYMARLYKHRNSEGLFNGDPVAHKKWADEVIIQYALDFIRRNQDRPYLAYLSFLTCHSPLDAPDDYIEKYESKGLSRNLSTLYAMVDHLDHHLGNFINTLEEDEFLNNTVIFFMSDNGPAILNNLLTDEDREIRYVNKLTGHKGNIWENGVKSPLFVRWDGTIKPGKSDELVDITDILPTLIKLAGLDDYGLKNPTDGISFSEILMDKPVLRPKMVFNYANPGWPPTDLPWSPEGTKNEYAPVTDKMRVRWDEQIISVINEDYKLLVNPGETNTSVEPEDGCVLVDIHNDPRERINLAGRDPAKLHELSVKLEAWFNDVLEETGSFGMPVFQIGYPGSELSVVKGKGPSALSSGLKNIFNMLTGFNEGGEWAQYNIRVIKPGNYIVSLELSGSPPEKSTFSMETKTEKIIIKPAENKSRINLSGDEEWIRLTYIDGDVNANFDLVNIKFILDE